MSADNLIAVAKIEGLWYVEMMFQSSLDDMHPKEIVEEMKVGKSFILEKDAHDYAQQIDEEVDIVEYGIQDLGSFGKSIFVKLVRIV